MSTAETKERFHELLCAGFSERGFAYTALPRKDPNHNRHSPFVKSTPAHLPPGSWEITVDVLTVRAGKHILPDIFCCAHLDAVRALLGDTPFTFTFSPCSVIPGEGLVPQIDRGDDPEPTARALFEIVDTVALPVLEKYSVLERLVEALAPSEGPPRDPISHELPCEIMAAIASAYLLNKLDACGKIARDGLAALAASRGDPSRVMHQELTRSLDRFYRLFLKPRGVEPGAWLRTP